MKMSYITFENDKKVILPKVFGATVFKMKDPEQVDKQILELKNSNYDIVFLSNQLASFSEDITKKYVKDDSIRIVIL